MRRLLRRLISRLYAARDKVARRVLGPRGDALVYVVLELAERTATRLRLPPGATIAFASDADVARAPLSYASTVSNADQALTGGDRCAAMTVNGRLVARAWVADVQPRVAMMLGGDALLPATVVYDVLVEPAERGRGLNAAMLAWIAEQARGRGRRRVVAWIAAWNRSSLRSFRAAGFRPITRP